MTLDQLNMLRAVAELGTLKAASLKLFKTQPAISQGIKQLEQQLNVCIFDRKGYRLTLTPIGQQIYQRALRVLSEASELKQLSSHLSMGNEANITLSFEASFEVSHFIPVLEMTQSEFPDTQIIIKQEHLTGAIESVINEFADMAFTPALRFQLESNQFDSRLIGKTNLVNVASKKLINRHPGLSNSKELRNEYQIILQDSGEGTAGIEMGVQSGQRKWYVNDYNTKKALTLSGMGWGKLPEHLIHNELSSGTLIQLPLLDRDNAAEIHFFALKLQSHVLGPVGKKLWENLDLLTTKYGGEVML